MTLYMLRTMLSWKARSAQVNGWVARANVFFILAIGRSGTAFLSSLLNEIPNTAVVHEPVKEDSRAYRQAFQDSSAADWYIESFRKKEIYLRLQNQPEIQAYGEVNSVLRRHVGSLQSSFPQATFIHLVRDGRDVVRSMMSRPTMQPDDPHTQRIAPYPGDPYFAEWATMDRFARLCWYWQVENAFLRRYINQTVQFEQLVGDYDYFATELLQPCGLALSRDVWQARARQPQNRTDNFQLPAWVKWDSSYQQTFIRICGEEMKECGYEC